MRLCAALILVLASASGPAARAAADPPRTLDLVATDDMKYSVPTLTARPGEQIRIRLTVKSALPKLAMAHNVVVLKIGTDVAKLVAEGAPHRATDFIPPAMTSSVIARTALAGAGEVVQVVFTAPAKPGRYPFICSFPGHYQSGMKGTLVVK
ncbi:MAG TPA: plastocyanin/azurin family copper-binding protein [Vicinamibacterales bacterium]|nr:plastocyanin/azurin family copper-binding protein [Vicinamibacterales bacterium]